MPEYPIQITKVQAPPLRDQTLARDRLLDWLKVKVHSRVVLVIAEAGYGKTTLLADFARRTRVRTLWFRLDRGDRDWVGFIAYLVAAVRVHVPGFAPITDSLLRETVAAVPPRESVIDTFLRELGELSAEPIAFIFDDLHLVDDAPDVRHVLRELLARAPERLSFVFLSRRTPPLALARLRAQGEVAALGTDDLRFDEAETERLFRETYEMRLEPALVAELSRRTEGWAASLQLVRAALRGRSAGDVRTFIQSLSGAEGHLYDYLAEEVVAELPEDLRQFLMRTSLLDTVDAELGPVAAGVSADEARRLIDDGERLGLFGRRGAQTRYQVRAHPLVRDFLLARLRRAIGDPGVREIHAAVAGAAEPIDWQVSTHHYRAAGADDDARRVLSDSLETILATGAYAAAEKLATSLRDTPASHVASLVVRARAAQQRGELALGLRLAELAHVADHQNVAAALTLMTARTLVGDIEGALQLGPALETAAPSRIGLIGRAFRSMIGSSTSGSLDEAAADLEQLTGVLKQNSELHFLGVALCNWAYIRKAQGAASQALDLSDESIALLKVTSAGLELVSARLARAWALAHLLDLEGARAEIGRASALALHAQQIEVAYEAGEIEAAYGDAEQARRFLAPFEDQAVPESDAGEQALLVRAWVRVRQGDLEGAARDVGHLAFGQHRTSAAFEARRYALRATVEALRNGPDALALARESVRVASRQGATIWARYSQLLAGLADPVVDPSSSVVTAADADPSVLSLGAELIVTQLSALGGDALEAVRLESLRRPERWRGPLRSRLDDDQPATRGAAAALLEGVGSREDVQRLRHVSRTLRGFPGAADLGRTLARRLAPRVLVEDLGRVRLVVGERHAEGSDVRRKVLALLCFLLTRPRFSCTREEVLEALWPDLDPASGLNSLNQTVYFLRRVFEPNYSEDLSPGYVHQDSEMVWLDTELVDSQSHRCREMLRAMPGGPPPEAAAELARAYRSRFALDFAYEDWAAAYRDGLHASFLRVIEQAIHLDISGGHFGRGTELAERAIEVEPNAEELQLALLRLYRMTGAHAAAAEQYAHYAQTLRDLGVEAPRLEDV